MSCFDNGNCNAVQIEYDGNGSLTDYTFPFLYQIEEEVHVEKWNADTLRYDRITRDQWSFKNATTVEFVSAPDYTFRIMRETDLEDLAVFYPGSSIKSDDLNDNFEQLKFAIEEGWCRVSTEFYCYLDEYIFDKRDLVRYQDQRTGTWPQPNNVEATDEVVTSGAAQAERWDTYMSDNVPAKTGANDQPAGERTQGGKRWYDTDKVLNYIWNDEIEAWVDYNLAGPQGPKGADGHHTGDQSFTSNKRPNGDP